MYAYTYIPGKRWHFPIIFFHLVYSPVFVGEPPRLVARGTDLRRLPKRISCIASFLWALRTHGLRDATKNWVSPAEKNHGDLMGIHVIERDLGGFHRDFMGIPSNVAKLSGFIPNFLAMHIPISLWTICVMVKTCHMDCGHPCNLRNPNIMAIHIHMEWSPCTDLGQPTANCFTTITLW